MINLVQIAKHNAQAKQAILSAAQIKQAAKHKWDSQSCN
jgi:hypothetical protein